MQPDIKIIIHYLWHLKDSPKRLYLNLISLFLLSEKYCLICGCYSGDFIFFIILFSYLQEIFVIDYLVFFTS